MERIMIIGCCGAGKSSFARQLHALTQIHLIHLDQHYWQPNWIESPAEEWKKKVQELAALPTWIIDGNYGGTMDIRIQKADTIIYLDYPTWKCLWRVLKRTWQNHGHERADMPKGCKERFDLDFLHYVATYNLIRRKKLLQKLEGVASEKNVIIFKHDRDARHFLERLK